MGVALQEGRVAFDGSGFIRGGKVAFDGSGFIIGEGSL